MSQVPPILPRRSFESSTHHSLSVPKYNSSGFFDNDPEVKKYRDPYFKAVSMGLILIIVIIIWGVLPIYWGSMFRAMEHVHNLHGLDLDGGEIGEAVTQAFLGATGPSTSMTWSVASPDDSLSTNSDFENAVVEERTWIVIAINANVSSSLKQAIASADGNYNGSLAVTVWSNEARNQNLYHIVYPQITGVLQKLDQQFAAQNVVQMKSATNIGDLLSGAPNVVTSPLGFTTSNVRPFDVPIVTVVNFVGLIYLTIISFVTTIICYNVLMSTPGLYQMLKFSHLIGIRLAYPFVAYFILSAFYTLLSFAFGAPFTRWYGGSGLVIYWMMAWCTMLALGLAIEAMITILTVRFLPFFLILWIVINVSSAFYPIHMLPGVFRYSYATPFYNLSRTVLSVCFNTKNEIGLNFGVQIAWIVASLCTISISQWFVSRRDRRKWETQDENEKPNRDV